MKKRNASVRTSVLALMEHAFSVGHELALHDAIILCHENRCALPSWALAELASRSKALVRNEKPKKKMGRHAAPVTEQKRLVSDARCYATVLDARSRPTKQLRGEDAFSLAAAELNIKSDETVRTAYRRHKGRIGKGTFYVSLAWCDGDYVGYLLHNELLLR